MNRHCCRRPGGFPAGGEIEDGFTCTHCHGYVCAAAGLSGVRHRNHCPYCLWSRHLDLSVAGDRLSACKAPMQPVGLTFKRCRKRYGGGRGELMLIHACVECGRVSINRLAADDDASRIMEVFTTSLDLAGPFKVRLNAGGILPLVEIDEEDVRLRLFGARSSPDRIAVSWELEKSMIDA